MNEIDRNLARIRTAVLAKISPPGGNEKDVGTNSDVAPDFEKNPSHSVSVEQHHENGVAEADADVGHAPDVPDQLPSAAKSYESKADPSVPKEPVLSTEEHTGLTEPRDLVVLEPTIWSRLKRILSLR